MKNVTNLKRLSHNEGEGNLHNVDAFLCIVRPRTIERSVVVGLRRCPTIAFAPASAITTARAILIRPRLHGTANLCLLKYIAEKMVHGRE